MDDIVIHMGSKKSPCTVSPLSCAMHCGGWGSRPGCTLKKRGGSVLYQRPLVRGCVYAIDGSGLGDDFRLVALVCVDDASDPRGGGDSCVGRSRSKARKRW